MSAATQFAFLKHVANHGLSYGTIEEFEYRQGIFEEIHAYIEEFNSGNETHTLGHNFMSTMNEQERERLNGYRPSTGFRRETADYFLGYTPSEVNWVTAGAVTPVKNQGSCGSCWSFSTTGGLEGAHQIATGNLVSLSEQQLVDCSTANYGCNGGDMGLAYMYTESSPLETEANYPYTGVDGTCNYNQSKGVVGASSYTNVTANDADALHASIAIGPTSVAIQANRLVFQLYTSGVITSTKCGTNLDHGVLAAGYGTDPSYGDYYLVKNSWGTGWGESGYVKIGVAAGEGICGIQMDPSRPSV